MSDKIVARSPMAEVERKLGLRPIEELLHERSQLVERVAALRALYGGFGLFDHTRKMELARIAGLIRAQALQAKIRMTVAEIEDASHTHPDYRDLITTATRERAEWCKLEAQLESIEWTVRRGDMIGRYIAAEARL